MDKQIKIAFILILIFIIISFGTTYILIKNNTNTISNNESDNKEQIKNEEGIDLYGTYNENDLLINDLVETYSGDEIKIPQIEGLKDFSIQEKINQEIYNSCFELLNSIETASNDAINNTELSGDGTMNNTDSYETYYDVMANFSNVISIHYIVYTNEHSDSLYFNYNLVTGERLKFEDLFLSDTNILEIVRRAFVERFSSDNYWENIIGGEYIASFDENELFKVVKGFMEKEEKEFMFSPSEIYFYYKDFGASVKLIDITDKVSIYTKYLTSKSIYERNDIGRKNIFTLVETHYDMFDTIDYGYLEDNFWYDLTVSKMYLPDENVPNEKMEQFNTYAKSLINEGYEKINEYREKAKENKDKFYILICIPNTAMYNDGKYESGEWTYTYSNMAISNLNTKVYEMPIELYNSEYKDKIIDAYRHKYFAMRGGMYYTIDEPKSGDDVTYIKEEEQRIYNYVTNKEINDLSEVFYEDVNFMETLEKEVRRELIEFYNYSENEAKELIKLAKYDFEGWSIKVNIPQVENFILNIDLGTFDISMLNIFDKEENI